MKDRIITPRYEEKEIETLETKEMIGRYLVDGVRKTWTEDFLDEDSGEIVTIERNQLLFEPGQKVSVELASTIDFHIQCGDITKPINVSGTNRTSKANWYNSYRPMMVHVSSGLTRTWLLVWADSFVHAIEVACDYFEQISTSDFYTFEVKYLGAELIDRDEFYKKQDDVAEQCDLSLNPLRFYTVDVIWKEAGTPYPFVNPSKEAKENLCYGTYVTMANSIEEANNIVGSEVSAWSIKNKGWKSIDIHFEKGKPMAASIIVPKEFCDNYREYFKKQEDEVQN